MAASDRLLNRSSAFDKESLANPRTRQEVKHFLKGGLNLIARSVIVEGEAAQELVVEVAENIARKPENDSLLHVKANIFMRSPLFERRRESFAKLAHVCVCDKEGLRVVVGFEHEQVLADVQFMQSMPTSRYRTSKSALVAADDELDEVEQEEGEEDSEVENRSSITKTLAPADVLKHRANWMKSRIR